MKKEYDLKKLKKRESKPKVCILHRYVTGELIDRSSPDIQKLRKGVG